MNVGGCWVLDVSDPTAFATQRPRLLSEANAGLNSVQANDEYVVFATAFGGMFGGNTSNVKVFRIGDENLVREFELTAEVDGQRSTVYTNNFAIVGNVMYMGVSQAGYQTDAFNGSPASPWQKWAQMNFLTADVAEVIDDTPPTADSYLLACKVVNGRIFVLTRDAQLYRRERNGSWLFVEKLNEVYNRVGPVVPITALTEHPSWPGSAFIDNFDVHESGTMYFSVSRTLFRFSDYKYSD